MSVNSTNFILQKRTVLVCPATKAWQFLWWPLTKWYLSWCLTSRCRNWPHGLLPLSYTMILSVSLVHPEWWLDRNDEYSTCLFLKLQSQFSVWAASSHVNKVNVSRFSSLIRPTQKRHWCNPICCIRDFEKRYFLIRHDQKTQSKQFVLWKSSALVL